MSRVAELCKEFKKDFSPKVKDPTKPVSCWSEKDLLENKVENSFVIIFRTKGCKWALESGCSMCGYFNDSLFNDITEDELKAQFDSVMNKYKNEKIVKIFTSGSFLDDQEISKKLQDEIIIKLDETADKISVESRPEFITKEKLSSIKNNLKNSIFEVGIGLETASDYIRENAVNKGFTYKDYLNSVKNLKKFEMKIKTYVLIKPLFLTEKESINDCIDTVKKIKNLTDVISFNPTNAQRKTLVEYLWKRHYYRPPWLWSVEEILKKSKQIYDGVIKCDVVGGGSARGANNCNNCNKDILKQITDFSLSQNINVFSDIICDCKEKWLDQIDLEKLTFGSIVDFS